MTEAAARRRKAMRAPARFAAASLACVGLSASDASAEERADPFRLRLHLRASVGAFYGYTHTHSEVVVDDGRATTLARFPAVYSGVGAGGELGIGLASRRVALGLLGSGQLTPQDRLGSAASVAGLRSSSAELLERSSLGPFLEARFDPLL